MESSNKDLKLEVKRKDGIEWLMPKNLGWTCPVCGAGLSPTTSKCPCGPKYTITYNYPEGMNPYTGGTDPIEPPKYPQE